MQAFVLNKWITLFLCKDFFFSGYLMSWIEWMMQASLCLQEHLRMPGTFTNTLENLNQSFQSKSSKKQTISDHLWKYSSDFARVVVWENKDGVQLSKQKSVLIKKPRPPFLQAFTSFTPYFSNFQKSQKSQTLFPMLFWFIPKIRWGKKNI